MLSLLVPLLISVSVSFWVVWAVSPEACWEVVPVVEDIWFSLFLEVDIIVVED